jgi:hypothetical protein
MFFSFLHILYAQHLFAFNLPREGEKLFENFRETFPHNTDLLIMIFPIGKVAPNPEAASLLLFFRPVNK